MNVLLQVSGLVVGSFMAWLVAGGMVELWAYALVLFAWAWCIARASVRLRYRVDCWLLRVGHKDTWPSAIDVSAFYTDRLRAHLASLLCCWCPLLILSIAGKLSEDEESVAIAVTLATVVLWLCGLCRRYTPPSRENP